MRAYLLYKDKTVKSFRKLVNTGGSVFDKYRVFAVHFLKYAQGDLDLHLAEYDKELDLDSIRLENVFPKSYKWMISDVSLKSSRNYLKSLESRITEFENGKEDNLKILIGIQFLRFVLVTKLVETYLAAAVELKKSGVDVSTLSLKDIGINRRLLKWFDTFQEFDGKSIDDWLSYNAEPATARYFYTSMKRILSIITSDDNI